MGLGMQQPQRKQKRKNNLEMATVEDKPGAGSY